MAALSKSFNFTPSEKYKNQTTGKLFYTTTSNGSKIVCGDPKSIKSIEQLIQNSDNPSDFKIGVLRNKNSFFDEITKKIINIDDPNLLDILKTDYIYFQQNKYNYKPIYTWIIKPIQSSNNTSLSNDPNLYKMFIKRVISQQEIGSLHIILHKKHPNNQLNSLHSIEPIGAGELRLESPTDISFNLLSGTFMAKKILKGKSENEKGKIISHLIQLVTNKLRNKDINAQHTDEDFISNLNKNKYICSSQNTTFIEDFYQPYYSNKSNSKLLQINKNRKQKTLKTRMENIKESIQRRTSTKIRKPSTTKKGGNYTHKKSKKTKK